MTAPTTTQPIRDETGYAAALTEVRRLWGSAPGTPDGNRLDVLTILVEAYENEHHPIELPDPIEAIMTRMDDLGMTRADLGVMLGVGGGRVSELLTRRRHLTLDMIRTLSSALSLPEACLLQQYDLAPASNRRGRPPARSEKTRQAA